MRAKGKRFCRRLVLTNKRKIWGILYPVLAVSLFLAGCGNFRTDEMDEELLPQGLTVDYSIYDEP